jgi:hypothetical protein
MLIILGFAKNLNANNKSVYIKTNLKYKMVILYETLNPKSGKFDKICLNNFCGEFPLVGNNGEKKTLLEQTRKIEHGVGTKVFTFVFSRKFSRNSLFVFAKDSLQKDGTFAKVFAKTKFLISRKLRGKNHSTANFVYSISKNMGKESEQRENDVVLQQISWGRKFRFRYFCESFCEI